MWLKGMHAIKWGEEATGGSPGTEQTVWCSVAPRGVLQLDYKVR